MRHFILIFFSLLSLCCSSQPNESSVQLSVAPTVDKTDPTNQKIITALQAFLETKNESATSNKYWLADDFRRYVYPYQALDQIENSKYGNNFYRPSLMQIINTKDVAKKIVKIAYIGHNAQSQENILRTVYTIVANSTSKGIIFSSYIDYAVRDWKKVATGSVTYYISPSRQFNAADAERQQQDIKNICTFFSCKPIDVTYYSCTDPVELFRVKGFDYNPMMYVSDTGGLAEPGNIVFSGNNSEYYTHEIVHIYIANLYPDAPALLNEGIATYLGGSGRNDYHWHKKKLAGYLEGNEPDLASLVTNPFERVYIDDETPVAYIIGGVICEKIIREYGKEKLFSLLQNKENREIWPLLKEVGMNKENLKTELLKQLSK